MQGKRKSHFSFSASEKVMDDFFRTDGTHTMRLVAAYIGIVLIWSTTSLALKWSAEAGFLAGVVSRMGVAAICAGLLMIIIGRRLPLNARAIELYIVGGVCTFGTLILICWGARFIPSGWISVIFGLTPILTSILGAVFRGPRRHLRRQRPHRTGGRLGHRGEPRGDPALCHQPDLDQAPERERRLDGGDDRNLLRRAAAGRARLGRDRR
jgi:hypothetical protein